MSDIGHNGVAAEELRSYVDRIETIEGEIKDRNADKRDIYTEARGRGLCAKTIKKIVRLRSMDPDKRHEEAAILDLYLSALGME